MPNRAQTVWITLCSALAVGSGCGGSEVEPDTGPPATVPQPASTPSATTAANAAPTAPPDVDVPPPRPPVEVTPWEATAPLDKIPTTKITAPKANEVIPADKVEGYEVKVDVADWPAAPDGPHVHLILDNKPYKPLYEAKSVVKLGEIVPGQPLAEGEHVLVAFPSRKPHVSVKPEKGKKPLAVVTFWVGKKGTPTWKATDPTLIFSRPKGTYNAEGADNVLLDFYLANVELGDGKYSVQATITPPVGDVKSMTIQEWKPFGIKNLPDGETKVKLELRDKAGQLVPGAWNSTERSVVINRGAPGPTAVQPAATPGATPVGAASASPASAPAAPASKP